ncbi:MAG: lipoate--protein ligase family protein [Anaerolineae bacterium]|nr:lipoate--protein ligase family protein [Anaerolineae bacterium]
MDQGSKSPAAWRLLIDDAADGATNMAVDEAIAEATVAGHALPTLRFYAWQPPCLSLGRNQPYAEVDAGRCAVRGYDIVRRPTGGRAILHTDELTYSVAGPADEPRLRGGVLEVYHRLSAGLLEGLRRLGIEAQETPAGNGTGADGSAACFEVPSAHEITAGGRKLVGSAQCRQGGWVLQHGSLPLRGDVTRIVDGLAFADQAERETLRQALRRRASTVAEVLGWEVSFVAAAEALAAGFAAALDLILIPGPLSAWEQARAAELRRTKYTTTAWTQRR